MAYLLWSVAATAAQSLLRLAANVATRGTIASVFGRESVVTRIAAQMSGLTARQAARLRDVSAELFGRRFETIQDLYTYISAQWGTLTLEQKLAFGFAFADALGSGVVAFFRNIGVSERDAQDLAKDLRDHFVESPLDADGNGELTFEEMRRINDILKPMSAVARSNGEAMEFARMIYIVVKHQDLVQRFYASRIRG